MGAWLRNQGGGDNSHWWPWKGDAAFGWISSQPTQYPDGRALRAQAEAWVDVAQRVYGSGHYLRPSLLQPYGCTRC